MLPSSIRELHLTLSAVLLLLAYPALWEAKPGVPPTICQVDGPVCLMQQAADVLIVEGEDGILPTTTLHGPSAAIVWNEAILRAADRMALERDRRDRGEAARRTETFAGH